MTLSIIFALFSLFSGIKGEAREIHQDFDRTAFYAAMASGEVATINGELAKVAKATVPEKEAYEGALQMKKAGLVSKPADKLKFFRSGRIKLESSLVKDSTNGEYHFLRLTIQEHAPKIVKYASDLEKDCQSIQHTFKNLSPVVQQAIMDYSKHSKLLRPEDFKL
ncbi:hypothetical protein ACX0G9_19820 [Flavitalea flava]